MRSGLVLTCCMVVAATVSPAAELTLSPPDPDTSEVQVVDPALPCTAHLHGEIGPGDGDRIVDALGAARQAWWDDGNLGLPILCLDSAGGSLAEALKITEFLRTQHIATKLEAGARCESACAMIFMGGTFFALESGVYDWRVMHPSAKLGFHAPALRVRQGDYTAATVTKSYNLALETIAVTLSRLVQTNHLEGGQKLKPSLLAQMLRTPSDQMMYVDTVDKAGRWNVTVGPLKVDHQMTTRDFRRACGNEIMWNGDESGRNAEYWDEKELIFSANDWGETLEVIYYGLTGEGCVFELPAGSEATGRVALDKIDGGYGNPLRFFAPVTQLTDLPY